jgi:serine protease inhibitor
MKKILLIFSLLLLITGCSNKDSINWFVGDLSSASSIADNKIIMLDFYTDW